jgi:putative ABC transport system permease protein
VVLALCVAISVSTIAGVDASETATAAAMEEYSEAAEATIEQTEQSMTAIMVTAGWMRNFSEEEEVEALDENMADEISSMDDVAAVVPSITQGFGEAETEGGPGMGEPGGMGGQFGRGAAYTVYGVPLDAELDEQYNVLPVSIVEGRSLEEGDDYAVLIGEELTDYFEAGVGDTIDIDGTSFEVVGVYSSTMMMQNQVYMDLSTAQDLLGMEGELSSLTVYAESTSVVDDVVEAIESAYPDLMVMAMSDMQGQFGDVIQRQQEGIIGRLDSDLAHIQSLGLSITLVAAISALLLIFGLMFYTVRERTKEIGTLKALGFSNSDVMKQFMFEGLYIGLIGGAIGLGIAALAASVLGSWLLSPSASLDVSVTLTLVGVLLGLGIAVFAGSVGSLYPAWRASRVSPMAALKQE